MITRSSTQEEVFEFLKDRCGALVSAYPPDTFRGIDGEVFLGLNDRKAIDTTFPLLSEPDKATLLLLHLPSSSPASIRDVTPPRTFTVPSEKNHSSSESVVKPIMGKLPRILLELWYGNSDHDREDFLAETWLPSLSEVELYSQTYRLALKRSIKDKEAYRVVSSRKWFGSFVVSMRYHRMDNRLDLFIEAAKELQLGNFGSENEFFLKVFSYSENSLSIVHRTARRAACQATMVEFSEQFTIRFSDDLSLLVAEKNIVENRDDSASIIIDSTTLKGLMLRNSTISPNDPTYKSLIGLIDLLTFAGTKQLYNFNPKHNRFEAYLLPTHEINAYFGAQYQIRSQAQLDALKNDEEYMRAHSQVVELLLISWGFGEGGGGGGWSSHSWLFRHALLSTILLQNHQSYKRLVSAGKSLTLTRQLDVSEEGFGEVLFTLMHNQHEAQSFWDKHAKPRFPFLKSPYLPPIRTCLGQLVTWL